MRKLSLVLLFVLALPLLACGGEGGGTLIETAAADMNLTAADLGSGYTLEEEEGLEQVVAEMDPDEADDAKDANLRMFSTPDGMGMVMSVVVNFKTVSAAEANMRGVMEGFEEGFNQEMPGTEFVELDDPNIGDDSVLIEAEMEGLGFTIYMLSFRQNNIMGLLAVFGMADQVSADDVTGMGQTMQGKIK